MPIGFSHLLLMPTECTGCVGYWASVSGWDWDGRRGRGVQAEAPLPHSVRLMAAIGNLPASSDLD